MAEGGKYPSCLVRDEAVFFDKNLQKTFRMKLLIWLHGNILFCSVGFLTTVASYYFTLSSSPSTYDLFFCTTWFEIFLACYSYEIFWFMSHERMSRLLTNVLTVIEKVERHCQEEQLSLLKSYKTIKLVRTAACGIYAFISAFICYRRVPDSRLPVFLRGLPFTDSRIVTLQAVQYVISTMGLMAGCHFIELLFTLILCIQSYFRALANKLKNSKGEEDIYQVIRLHSELLGSSEELFVYFEPWLSSLLVVLFTVSQLLTISIIKGSTDPEFFMMVPSQMNSMIIICLFSDFLQQSTECFADLAYSLQWRTASRKTGALILMIINRSQKPLSLRCPVVGALCLPVAMNILSKWYKFVQLLMKVI